jgi:hypothetical protein
VQEVSDDDDAGVAQDVMYGMDIGPLAPIVANNVEYVGDPGKGQQESAPRIYAGPSNVPPSCHGVASARGAAEVPRGSEGQAGRQQPTAKHVHTPAPETDGMSQSSGGKRGARRQGKLQ